jgi:signal peptidase I
VTATAHAIGGTAASTGRLPSVASGVLEFVWPLYLTLVLTLGGWVAVPTLALGWEPVTIISGSMAPTIQPGHVVVVAPYEGEELRAGDVVTYRDAEADRLVTHRIASVHDDGTYVTRGDANAVDDRLPLSADQIVGVGRLVVPAAGLPSLWAHEGRTELLAGLAGLTAVCAGAAAGAASASARSMRDRLRARRSGVGPRRTLALTAVLVVVLGGLGATAVTRAAFVGAETNHGNSFHAGSVGAPSGLTAEAGCTLLVSLVPHAALSWTGAPGATGYRILRAEDAGAYSELTTVTGTSHTDTSVSAGRTYHYKVTAFAGSWTGGEAGPVRVDIPLLLC